MKILKEEKNKSHTWEQWLLMAAFSREIMKVKMQWNKFKVPEEKKVNQGFYIPQNSFKNEGKISTLSDKQKLR